MAWDGGRTGNSMSGAVLGGSGHAGPKKTAWPAAIGIVSSGLSLQISQEYAPLYQAELKIERRVL